MKPKSNRFVAAAALSAITLSSSAFAARLYKDVTTTDLNAVASWATTSGGATDPASIGTTDALRFNEIFAPTSGTDYTAALSADLAVGGIELDSGSVSGGVATGNVIISAGNILTLNGASAADINYATGGIVLNSGTGGALTINANIIVGATQQWVTSRGLTIGGNVDLGSGTARTLTVNATTTTLPLITGVISGTTGNFTKSGSGTLYLNQVANSFGGTVTAVGGTLKVDKLADGGSPSSVGSGSSVIALNGSALNYVGSTTDSTNRAIDMRASSSISNNGTGGQISFTAANVAQTLTASARTLTLGGSNANANTLGSILGDSGTGANIASLAKSGAGTWIASGANTYTGATSVNLGTLKAGVASVANVSGAFGKNSALTLANAANTNLDLNGFDTQIGSLTGGGATGGNVILGANTLTIGGNNTSPAAYAGAISGTGGGITKIGSGTLTLSGASDYTGATSVNAGTLSVTGSQTGSAVAVASTATLGGTGTVGATTVASGGLLAPGAAGAGKLTTGDLAFAGTSTITLGVYSGYTAAPAIAAGALTPSGAVGSVTINLGGAAAVGGTYQLLSYTGGSIAGTGASAFVLGTMPVIGGRQSQSLVDTGSALNWVVSGASPIWTGAESNEWSTNVIAGLKNWTLEGGGGPTDYLAGDLVMFDDSATGTTVDISVADVAPASMLFSNGAKSYTIQGSFGITAGVLAKSGGGELIIRTANSYSGGTTLSGGILRVATSDSALGSGALTVAGTSTLATASGGGARVLANAVVINAGQTLSLDGGYANLTVNGALSGSGTLNIGNGTSTLGTTSASYTGAITSSSTANALFVPGTLAAASFSAFYPGTLGVSGSLALSGDLTVSTGGTETVSGAGSITVGGVKVKNYSTVTFGGSGTTLTDSGLFNLGDASAQYGTWNQSAGTVNLNTATAGQIRVGHWGGETSTYALSGGTLNVPNIAISLGWDGNGILNISGGIANLKGIKIADSSAVTGTVGLTGGTLNLGSLGIVKNNAGGTATLNFGAANVGASADWSSALNMTLTDAATGTTFNTLDSVGGVLARTITLSGVLSSTGKLVKAGAGTLVLSAASNSYGGGTTVSAGELKANVPVTAGAQTTFGSGDITVNAATVRFATGSTSNAQSYANAINLNGGTLISDDGVVTYSGLVSLAGSNTVNARYANKNAIFSNVISGAGSVDVTGPGTVFFNGVNTYTGNTTVATGGLLTLADNAQLKFALGASSGVNNSLSGAGTATLNGDFAIDTSAASALTSGTWTLENVTSLTGAYGASFTVVGFTDAGSDKWTLTAGSKLWSFDETTGVLTLSSTASFTSWIDGFTFAPLADKTPTGDPDNDGINNATEMVLGGNPATGMDAALAPTIQLVTTNLGAGSTNYLLFTFRRTDLSVTAAVTSVAQYGTNLSGWTSAVDGVDGVVVQEDNDFVFVPASPNTDRVRVYVPRGSNTKLFGRLNVTVP